MRKTLLIMLGLLLSLPALARDFTYEYEGQTLTYTVLDDDVKTCMTKRGSYNGETYTPGNNIAGDLKIPAIAKDGSVEYTVEVIGGGSFWSCPDLTSVDIPNSVMTIEASAFALDSSLKEMKISDSVIAIGCTVFYGCTSLESIVIPDSVVEIDYGTFANCSNLTSVKLGNSLKETGYSLFANCTSLESIVIPDSIEILGDGLFSGCTALKTAVVGNSVKEIPAYLFNNCESLTSITLGNSINKIGDLAFNYCTSLTSLKIPDSVETFGECCFQMCIRLNSVYLGKSAKNVNSLTFNKCSALQSIDVSADNEKFSSIDGILYNKDATLLILCPIAKTSVDIPNSVVIIGQAAFRECNNITDIDVPLSVETIEYSAFYNCTGLTSIHLPQSLTTINESAFSGCVSMETIDIPDGVISIGQDVFSRCSGLKSVRIGASLEEMGIKPFSQCKKLKSIEVSEKNNTFASKNGILYNKDFTELIRCPEAYEAIYINIPETVISLSDMALDRCNNLQSIVIPNSVSSIGAWMFCNNVKSIILPRSLTFLGYMSLTSNLKEIYFTSFEPIEGDDIINSDSIYEETVLYVPGGSLSKFQSTLPWSNFANIIEIDYGNIPGFVAKVENIYLSPADLFRSEDNAKVSLRYGVPGAQIYYCLIPENSESTGEYTLYTEPIEVAASSTLNVYVEYFGNKTEVNTYKINVENPGHDAGYEFTYEYEGQSLSYIVLDPKTKTCYTKPGRIENDTYFPGNNVSGDVKIPSVVTADNLEYKVIAIGAGSFMNCPQLKSVDIPTTVTIIDNSAFAYCSELTDIILPNSITKTGETVFFGCTSLQSIVIPDSTEILGAAFFAGCSSLKDVVIGNSVRDIPQSLFYQCTGLTSITMGESVSNLGYDWLYGCYAVETFNVSERNQKYSSVDGILYSKDITMLIRCPHKKVSVDIPTTVTAIEGDAFAYCYSLTDVKIPDTISIIAARTFYDCKALTSVDIPDSVESIGGGAFNGCSKLVTVKLGKSVSYISENAFGWCRSLESFSVSEENKTYASKDGVLYNKDFTELISCPGSFTSIEIPNSVVKIGGMAFNASKLVSVNIPNSVVTINDYAFDRCYDLKSIFIPKSVTTIGYSAFTDTGLEEIYYDTDTPVTDIENIFSDNIYNQATLYIPQGSLQTFNTTTPWDKFSQIIETGFVANVVATTEDCTILDKKIDYVSDGAFELSLTCSQENAKIYYRLTPVSSIEILAEAEYMLYTGPIEVTSTSILSVYAENDGNKSPVKGYKILVYVNLTDPVAKVGDKILSTDETFKSTEAVEVELSCKTEDAEIYYLLTPVNAAEPSAEAEYTLYTEPFKVDSSAQLKVYAVSHGLKSDVLTYDIDIKTNMVSMTMAELEGDEIYTLEGLKVAYPVAGKVYIVRKHGCTFKVLVK